MSERRYELRSEDTLFSNGEIEHNNYGIWFDGSVGNVIENSSSLGNTNNDIRMQVASRELLLLNTRVDITDFQDDDSEFTERFYLDVEFQGRTGPVSGVDVEVTEMLTHASSP